MNTKIVEGEIAGIPLRFRDFSCSDTVEFVFGEFHQDMYGLEKIRLDEHDTVLDVGANVGMFSIYVKKKFGCRVVAFEPVPELFNFLCENILLNGLELEDFELHNCAVYDTDGESKEIGTLKTNSGCSSLMVNSGIYEKHANQELLLKSQCKTETLGKYIDSTCKYLKMDTEGAEHVIIPNILNQLNQFSYIGMELHDVGERKAQELHDVIAKNFHGTMFYNFV